MSQETVEVNGSDIALKPPPHQNALDWLRQQGLTGAKEGCAEGECGACSILVARPGVDASTEWTAMNACLMPAASLAGAELVTAEGLGTPTDMHPVQREMASRGGSQCGYCTPGFVCSMAAEYYRPGRGEHFDIHALSGNLCRCTGYKAIKEAADSLGTADSTDVIAARTLEPPPVAAAVRTDGYVRPRSLTDALDLMRAHPHARVVAGSTDTGVEINLHGMRPEMTLAVGHLDELRELRSRRDETEIGAGLTLSEVERRLDGAVPLLHKVFPLFASRLIRNAATIGGNIGTGSPIGDLAPALLALDAEVVLCSSAGSRRVALKDYFKGYRTTVREPDELIRSVIVPHPLAQITAFHKIAKRRFDDISSVAVALSLDIVEGTVTRARIGLGGVAATPIRAFATETALIGREWNSETVAKAAAVMATEGTPLDDHRASSAYRSAMLGQSLRRLHADLEEGPR